MKYLKPTTLLLIVLFMMGCADNTNNENKATEWISNAAKPILVFKSADDFWNERSFTLVDSLGKCYYTGYNKMNLPDTIK